MIRKKIIIAVAALLSLASCKKVLNITPEYVLDGQELKSVADYESALTGAYRGFLSTNYYSATSAASNAFACLPDMLSDNLNETGESLGNERVFSRWAYAEDENQIENTWLAAYRIIARANIVTRHIDDFAATDPGAVNRIKAQALAIRALAHFDLLRYFVDNYDRNSALPGIPYINVFDYEQKPPRGTVKTTYDNIELDLKTALTLMGSMDHTINTSGRPFIDAIGVDAILARMYLYSNQLDSAIKYSTLVINARPLSSRTNFPNIWTDASTTEVVWNAVFEVGQGAPGNNVFFPVAPAPNGRSEYRPNPTLVASYDQANDIRYSSYFKLQGSRLVLSKYLAKAAQLSKPDGVVNFKVFRTGEMFLIRAEAYARKGGANEALGLADLNTLRAARILGYVPVVLAGAPLMSAIEQERRKELICEGHRWFDLKRTTRTISRNDCSSFCTLAAGNRAWTWPIPQPEIDANPNILPQNPGY
ncbi:MAG TPA: RagB/SusD family nutrient uptake outer membrane protein [Chitinophagaceae bacterium]|nr:RagB/SusD family nutrient uptake outer membrane protein [Chitinophagaceae bacterium]